MFPCPRRMYNKLRLHLDMDERRASRQLRNVGICVIKQLLDHVRIIRRSENGRTSGNALLFYIVWQTLRKNCTNNVALYLFKLKC